MKSVKMACLLTVKGNWDNELTQKEIRCLGMLFFSLNYTSEIKLWTCLGAFTLSSLAKKLSMTKRAASTSEAPNCNSLLAKSSSLPHWGLRRVSTNQENGGNRELSESLMGLENTGKCHVQGDAVGYFWHSCQWSTQSFLHKHLSHTLTYLCFGYSFSILLATHFIIDLSLFGCERKRAPGFGLHYMNCSIGH